MSDATIISLATTVGGILILLVKSHYDTKKILELRKQDRLDRESDAAIARANMAELMQAGEQRKEEIIKATKRVGTVALKSALKSEQAIRVANGHNEKIQQAVEISKGVLEKIKPDNLAE